MAGTQGNDDEKKKLEKEKETKEKEARYEAWKEKMKKRGVQDPQDWNVWLKEDLDFLLPIYQERRHGIPNPNGAMTTSPAGSKPGSQLSSPRRMPLQPEPSSAAAAGSSRPTQGGRAPADSRKLSEAEAQAVSGAFAGAPLLGPNDGTAALALASQLGSADKVVMTRADYDKLRLGSQHVSFPGLVEEAKEGATSVVQAGSEGSILKDDHPGTHSAASSSPPVQEAPPTQDFPHDHLAPSTTPKKPGMKPLAAASTGGEDGVGSAEKHQQGESPSGVVAPKAMKRGFNPATGGGKPKAMKRGSDTATKSAPEDTPRGCLKPMQLVVLCSMFSVSAPKKTHLDKSAFADLVLGTSPSIPYLQRKTKEAGLETKVGKGSNKYSVILDIVTTIVKRVK